MHGGATECDDGLHLLLRAQGGDRAAVRQLLDQAGPVVYGFVFARVGGDTGAAEDIVQETFLEAMRSAAGFRGEAAVTTWLCAIARHRLARYYERERRQEMARSSLTLVGDEAVVDAPDSVEERDALVRALGSLSALHRQVLILKYLDDRSVSDIADELGRSRVQVQSLLQRARDGLRRQLEGSA